MSVIHSLPAWLEELLDSCPTAGNGVNDWLYEVAKQLHSHMDEEEMFALLKEKSAGCGRVVSDAEIRRQIECARANAWQPRDIAAYAKAHGEPRRVVSCARGRTDRPPVPKWPAADHDAIQAIVGRGFGLVDLWESSPRRFDDNRRHTEEIIDVVFPANPLLSCGHSLWHCGELIYRFRTFPRAIWRGYLAGLPLITPSPVLVRKALTKGPDPHWSEHCLAAVAKRIYLIIEFDFSEYAPDGKTLTPWAPLVREWLARGITVADACAALHRHLAERLPLVAAVSSAGKPSIHGWYQAFNHTDGQLRPFMEYAVTLGADPRLWTRSQFTRMPDGTRENGKTQTCFYLDPGKAVTSNG